MYIRKNDANILNVSVLAFNFKAVFLRKKITAKIQVI